MCVCVCACVCVCVSHTSLAVVASHYKSVEGDAPVIALLLNSKPVRKAQLYHHACAVNTARGVCVCMLV